MAKFKRSISLNGKFQDLNVKDGKFIDAETGEVVDVAGICESIYGNETFTISTTHKSDEDVE